MDGIGLDVGAAGKSVSDFPFPAVRLLVAEPFLARLQARVSLCSRGMVLTPERCAASFGSGLRLNHLLPFWERAVLCLLGVMNASEKSDFVRR